MVAKPSENRPHPTRSVGFVVRRARLARSLLRLVEALLLAVAAACATLGAIALSGGAVDAAGAWIAALLAGASCGLSWKIEHASSEAETARELDQRLRYQGSLFTAWEHEGRGPSSSLAEPRSAPVSMARLLEERVLARLRLGEALRSTMPRVAVPVAAPLLGAALLAFALERPRGGAPLEGARLEGLVGELAVALSELENEVRESGAFDPATLSEVARSAARALALEERIRMEGERSEELAREIEDLELELARLAELLGPNEEARARLEEAWNWLDSARVALESRRDRLPATAFLDDREPGGVTEDSAQRASEASKEGQGPRELPSFSDASQSAAVLHRDTLAREPGTLAETFWPPEYDGIVSGWVELRRRSEASSPGPEPFPR